MDRINESTFDYIRENIFVIIDKEVQYSTDDGDSRVISYLFNKPLFRNDKNTYCVWSSSCALFGSIYGKADYRTLSFFDLCGPLVSWRHYYKSWIRMPELGDCVIYCNDLPFSAFVRLCDNNRGLIAEAVREVLKNYNLL